MSETEVAGSAPRRQRPQNEKWLFFPLHDTPEGKITIMPAGKQAAYYRRFLAEKKKLPTESANTQLSMSGTDESNESEKALNIVDDDSTSTSIQDGQNLPNSQALDRQIGDDGAEHNPSTQQEEAYPSTIIQRTVTIDEGSVQSQAEHLDDNGNTNGSTETNDDYIDATATQSQLECSFDKNTTDASILAVMMEPTPRRKDTVSENSTDKSLNHSSIITSLTPSGAKNRPASTLYPSATPAHCLDLWRRKIGEEKDDDLLSTPEAKLLNEPIVSFSTPYQSAEEKKIQEMEADLLHAEKVASEEARLRLESEERAKELEKTLSKLLAQQQLNDASQESQNAVSKSSTDNSVANTAQGSALAVPDPQSLWERNFTLVKEVRFADQTCVELSGENKALEKDLRLIEEQLELQKEDSIALNKELQDSIRQCAKSDAKCEALQERIQELESLDRRQLTEFDRVRVQADQLQGENRSLQDDLFDSNARCKVLGARILELESSVGEKALLKEEESTKLKNENQFLNNKLQESNQNVTDIEARCAALRLNVTELKSQERKLLAKVDATNTEVANLRCNNDALRQSLNSALEKNKLTEARFEDISERSKYLEAECHNHIKEQGFSESQQKVLSKENESLKLTLADSREEKTRADTELSRLKAINSELKVQNQEQRNKLSFAKDQVEQIRAENANQEVELRKLIHEKNQQDLELTSAQNKHVSLQRSVLGAKLTRWARSIQKYGCTNIEEDGVVMLDHCVHFPGRDDKESMDASVSDGKQNVFESESKVQKALTPAQLLMAAHQKLIIEKNQLIRDLTTVRDELNSIQCEFNDYKESSKVAARASKQESIESEFKLAEAHSAIQYLQVQIEKEVVKAMNHISCQSNALEDQFLRKVNTFGNRLDQLTNAVGFIKESLVFDSESDSSSSSSSVDEDDKTALNATFNVVHNVGSPNLEVMEEARGDSACSTKSPSRTIGESSIPENEEESFSVSMSSIAGISHLFSDGISTKVPSPVTTASCDETCMVGKPIDQPQHLLERIEMLIKSNLDLETQRKMLKMQILQLEDRIAEQDNALQDPNDLKGHKLIEDTKATGDSPKVDIPTKRSCGSMGSGMYAKVRFATKVKRDGKIVRKKTWFGGRKMRLVSEECNALSVRLEALEKEKEQLEIEARTNKAAMDVFHQKLEASSTTIAEISKERDSLRFKAGALENEKVQVEADLITLSKKLDFIRKQFSALGTGHNEVELNLEAKSAVLDRTLEQFRQMQVTTEALFSECEMLRINLAGLAEAKLQAKSTVVNNIDEQLRLAIEHRDNELRRLNGLLADSKNALGALEAAYKNDKEAAEALLLETDGRLLQTQNLLETTTIERDRYAADYAEVNEKLNRCASDFAHENSIILKQLDDKEKMLKSVVEAKDVALEDIAKLRAELNNVEMKLSSRRNVKDLAAERLDDALGQLSQSEKRNDRLQRKLVAVGEKCNRFRYYIRQLTNKCDDWEAAYKIQSKAVEKLKSVSGRTKHKASKNSTQVKKDDNLFLEKVAAWSAEKSKLSLAQSQLEVELDDIAKLLDVGEVPVESELLQFAFEE